MRLNRFYTEDVHDKAGKLELGQKIWVHDQKLLNQWFKVLRFKPGDELILFNKECERIYRIDKIEFPNSVHLLLVTESEINLPKKHMYLFWSLLKNDKNDLVLQKATELGVREFVPLITERTENKVFNVERSAHIIREAAEQCGRFDIPIVKEPALLKQVLKEYNELKMYVCEASSKQNTNNDNEKFGVLVGPEGGWSASEKQLFEENKIEHLNLSQFTLRAETASIIAAAKLLQ